MNYPVKVMHVVLSLECGGLENIAIELASGLDDREFSSSICCINKHGELADMAGQRGIKLFCLDKKAGFSMYTIIKLAWLLKREKIHIVHSHNPGAMIYAAIAARIARIPVVINTRHGRNIKIVNRYVWAMNDSIVSISKDAQNRLLEYNHINPKLARVIYNGIKIHVPESKRKQIKGIAEGDMVVATVGRLVPDKDYFTLLDAFAQTIKIFKNAKLLFVGDGVLRQELESYCADLGLKNNVIFLGFRQDVAELLGCADIFVLSSLTEGISLALLEAMSAGLPVVATDVGGNPEVVANGDSGFLVPARNPEMMAEKIATLLLNSGLAHSMGETGRHIVETSFSLERMLNDYKDLYLEIMSDKKLI